jgi:hypothetical protein
VDRFVSARDLRLHADKIVAAQPGPFEPEESRRAKLKGALDACVAEVGAGERDAQREAMLEEQMRRASRYILVAPVMVSASTLLLVAAVTLITAR